MNQKGLFKVGCENFNLLNQLQTEIIQQQQQQPPYFNKGGLNDGSIFWAPNLWVEALDRIQHLSLSSLRWIQHVWQVSII